MIETIVAPWMQNAPPVADVAESWAAFLRGQNEHYGREAALAGTTYRPLPEAEMQAVAALAAAIGAPLPLARQLAACPDDGGEAAA